MSSTLRFAQFEIESSADGTPKELGRGGMGVTYKAFDTRLRRPVVLKVIRDGLLNDDTASRRFLREARAAARIQHPNIATVFDQGHEGDTFFYAMEFIEGETLQSLIRREGTLPPKLALEIILQVAKALQAAWGEKVIHRDIKPANIMLAKDHYGSGDLVVKLIDFGLAKAAVARRAEGMEGGGDDGPITLTQDGGLTAGFVGTPHFASPEQIEPDGELDIRSDIYSLGVTLWYALAGSPPFSGSSFVRVAAMHLSKAPPFEELTDAPPPVIALLKRMLAKEREGRPSDPTELRREIEAALRALESGAVPGPSGARVAVSSAGLTPVAAGVESFATLPDSMPSAAGLLPSTPPQSTPRPPVSLPPPPPGPPVSHASAVPPPPPPPPVAPAWPPAAGAVLAGRWQLVQAVGEDVTGKLFRAVDRMQGNLSVAIRALRSGIARDAGQLARAQEACAIVARLGQPALIGGLSLQTVPEGTFATLEWLESRTLQDLLRTRGGTLPASEVHSILEQAAAACDAAANEGLKTLDLHLGQVALHLPDGPPQEGWPALLARPLAHWPRWQLKINALDLFNDAAPPAPDADAAVMTMVGGASLGGADARPLAQRYAASLAALGYELLGGSPQRVEPRRLQSQGYTSVATLGEEGNQVLKSALLAAPGQGFATSSQFISAFAPTLPRRSLPPATVAGGMPGAGRESLAPSIPPVAPPPAPPPVRSSGGSNKGLLVGVAAALIIVGGGLAWKFLGGKKVEEDPKPDTPTPTPAVVTSGSTPTPPPAPDTGDDAAATAGLPREAASLFAVARKSERTRTGALLRAGDELQAASKPVEAVAVFERATELEGSNATAWERLAYARLLVGKMDEAARAAERATTLNASQAGAWRTLGITRLIRYDFPEAKAALERATASAESPPRSAAAAVVLMDALMKLGRTQDADTAKQTWGRAIEVGRRATEQFASDADVWRFYGNALAEAGQADRGIEALQRAVQLRAGFVGALTDLGGVYRDAGQDARSLEMLNRATQASQAFPLTYVQLGATHLRAKRWNDAVTAYRRAVQLAPDLTLALNGMGESFLRSDRPRDALDPLQKVTRLAPNFAVGWKNLAEARRRTQSDRGASAIEAAERAVSLAPQFGDAHYELGAAYNNAQRYSDAITSLRRATELNPANSAAWNSLGVAYHGNKQLQQSLDAFLRATKEDPNNAVAWDNAGEIYRQRGEKQSALDAFRRATVADPNYAEGWIDTGRALCDFKQFDDALKSFQRATEVAPRNATAWQWIGYAYNELKQHDRAVPAFRKAVDLAPNYAVAWNNLGFAYERLGRDAEAIEAYERATKADPQLQVSWKSLAGLYEKAGRTADANRARANASGTPPKPTLGPGPTPRRGNSDLDAVLKEMESLGGGR